MVDILFMSLFESWYLPYREVTTSDQTIKSSEWSGCCHYWLVFFIYLLFFNDQHSILISLEWVIPSFCIPKINLLPFFPPSDSTMTFYWHQLCFIAFSALLATVLTDDTNWFHCHTLPMADGSFSQSITSFWLHHFGHFKSEQLCRWDHSYS